MTTELSPQEQQITVETTQVLASKQDALMQLGQIQAFNFIGKLVTVSELKILQQVKDSKNYKGLTYKGESGKLETVSTWDQCCEKILGMSRKSVDERLLNLSQFGEAFFEQAQAMRLGYRDLKALRQLPSDEQALVIESEAVETGDKEAVKDLIDDLKAQHKKELDAEKLKTKEVDTQRQVAIRMRDEYQMKAMDYQTELESTKFKADAWKDQTKHLLFEATKYESNAIESLSRLIALRDHFLDNDDLSPQVVEHLAAGLLHSFKTLAEDFAQAWLETSSILEGYLPKMRPSLDVLQELNDSAMSNEE
ncbi:hypothetical protein [Pseudoalteromonas sp.]|uniref:hypothetical protein n=1 Tax=Pseudoalteromonas sp. TaxID=53249 RepID=UPI002624C5E6|nr:hypothetical protein [Pseudoalteromonas sp.]MCP4589042.1 hypothetical protein [Pseudoalteromonas sp.]